MPAHIMNSTTNEDTINNENNHTKANFKSDHKELISDVLKSNCSRNGTSNGFSTKDEKLGKPSYEDTMNNSNNTSPETVKSDLMMEDRKALMSEVLKTNCKSRQGSSTNLDHQNILQNGTLSDLSTHDEKLALGKPRHMHMLVREDTALTGLDGCVAYRAQFVCSRKKWSALCWGKLSDRKYYTLIILLSGIFVLSLIGTVFFIFTNVVHDAILSNMVIRNNSIAYDVWRKPSVLPVMKVYIYNYTNWERVKYNLDEKLHVEELGPYSYTQQLERVNMKFDGDKLSFNEISHFRYLPGKTNGTSLDRVLVPNMPYLSLIPKAVNLAAFTQFSLDKAVSWSNHPNAFVNLSVHEFLWGYNDDIMNVAKPIMALQGQNKYVDNFGLLATKNNTLSERFTINTGEVDIDKMNIIEKVDGRRQLNFWSTSECNSLEATDGSIFPPSMLENKNKTLYVYYPNLCRRLPFIYKEDVELEDGVKLLRYHLPDNVFGNKETNPENECFCDAGSSTCPPEGVVNVTVCTMGAPALASFPHFHRSDPSLREAVTGMKDSSPAHDTYLDIHPTLGIALRGKSSLQINMQVIKTDLFSAFKYIRNGMILPIAWVEMGVEELPQSLRALIYHGTYSTAAVQLGLQVTSILAAIISGLCLFVLMARRKQKPCMMLKTLPKDIAIELKNQSSCLE